MDLAHGHVLALQALQGTAKTDVFASVPKSEGRFRAYNLGSGGGQSVLDISKAMTKATGVEYKMEIVGRRCVLMRGRTAILAKADLRLPDCSVGDVPVLTADPAVAEKELGFQASHTLDQMCADLWRWQSQNPNGYE